MFSKNLGKPDKKILNDIDVADVGDGYNRCEQGAHELHHGQVTAKSKFILSDNSLAR
jgi:hypothetical protein